MAIIFSPSNISGISDIIRLTTACNSRQPNNGRDRVALAVQFPAILYVSIVSRIYAYVPNEIMNINNKYSMCED